MIHDASKLPLPGRLEADLCVVGSGPGGATVAMVAAEAGLRVVVLEAGPLVTPGAMNQREEDMLPALLWSSGSRTTRDRDVRIHQGRCVGGSSVHNLNLCKRIPDALLSEWHIARPLERLPPERWAALYDETERLLSVESVPRERWNRHNRLLEAGCASLGWRGGGLRHNRTGCIGSGFCEVGCAYDAKNHALKIAVPRAIRAGASVLARAQAIEVLHEGGRVTGVRAAAIGAREGDPLGELVVHASRVCLAASATGTPAILQRSGVPDPSGTTGRSLRIHPAVAVAGEFADPVHAWRGIPQTYECTEHLDPDGVDPDRRLWIVPAFAHPMGFATMLPGHGAFHREWMTRYDRLAVLTAMLHDETRGTVEPDGDLGVSIDYWPEAEDRRQLASGLAACARLLFAAGALRVIVPGHPPRVLEPGDDPAALASTAITRQAVDLTAVHPMASVPMGDDPATAAVNSEGRHHHLDGLWIADGSVFPASIGVPPQLSIYAMGLHVGRALAAG